MEDLTVDKKSKKKSSQGKQTLFRVTYRTQINLIRIADNKANMIMGINAMMITILIGILSSQMIFSSEDINSELNLIIPVVLIMLTSLLSAFYAIRAAKPRLILFNRNTSNSDNKGSLLFFENIRRLSLDDYMSKMEKVLQSPAEIYQNMITDIYNQAKVLHRKYYLLRTAYVIFIVGFSFSIISFLLLWLLM